MAQRFLTPEVYLESQAGWDDGLVVRNREGEEAVAALGRRGGLPRLCGLESALGRTQDSSGLREAPL